MHQRVLARCIATHPESIEGLGQEREFLAGTELHTPKLARTPVERLLVDGARAVVCGIHLKGNGVVDIVFERLVEAAQRDMPPRTVIPLARQIVIDRLYGFEIRVALRDGRRATCRGR